MVSLPYDVLHHVVARASPSSYVALCRTTRDLHAMTTPLLFRNIDLDSHQQRQAELLLDVLTCSESLGRHVISFRAYALLDTVATHKVCPALRKMPRLQHLDFTGLDAVLEHHMDDVVDILKGLKDLTSVKCWWIDERDVDIDRMLDALPPLERLIVDADGHHLAGLHRLLLRSIDTLEYLSSQDYELEVFLTRSDAQGRVWRRMRELKVIHFRSTRLAHAFPNLTRLYMFGNPPEAESVLWDQNLLPRLEQLSFPLYGPLPDIALRQDHARTIPHFDLSIAPIASGHFATADFLDIMRCLNWQSLRTLSLWISPESFGAHEAVLDTLPSVFESCSSLRYFGLASGHDDQRDAMELVSMLHGWILKARQIRFVDVKMAVILSDMDGNRDRDDPVHAHLAHGITTAFDTLEHLRVVQFMVSRHPDEVYWTWTSRGDSPEDGTTARNVDFRAVIFDRESEQAQDVLPLPESLSDIVDLVDRA
ncbi:hypothetical protein EXIGLDRAFT_832413 [Exidia glandulosa HHB12029]|uniref:F-box domain-containing protein n=1 Tax=Exidia glandulosa HHB12029 TaxID=1314781 RepID=A0A165LPR6_EXIGL|nr:hypothetical protein EXIGLDRAFT_832413 [Exidia glandulosa HHB12029]